MLNPLTFPWRIFVLCLWLGALLPPPSLVVAPAKTNHYVLTKQPTVIEVTAMGPLQFTYVNPADDPSKK